MTPGFHSAEFKLSVVILSVILIVLFQGCQKPVDVPARTIVGVYATVMPVYFKDQSDSCTDVYAIYDSTLLQMSWTITYAEENLVNVNLTAPTSDSTIRIPIDSTGTLCSLGRQYQFPMQLRGIVGGIGPDQLVVERAYQYTDTANAVHTAYYQLGNLTVSHDTISGSLSDLVCDSVKCLGYQTNSFYLVRRQIR